jgi:hypothetical protein
MTGLFGSPMIIRSYGEESISAIGAALARGDRGHLTPWIRGK